MGEFDRGSVAPIADTLARDDWPVLVALPAVASLFVFAAPRFGWWAFALAGLVYVAGFVAFDRTRAAEQVHEELVTTLGRIPEVGGLAVAPGRSDRVSGLARRVADELDLKPRSVVEVAAAARCGVVGRLGYDVWPHLRLGYDDRAAARWSAGIVDRAPAVGRIPSIVGPSVPTDSDAAVMRSIVELVSAYDDAVHAGGLDPAAALEKVAETGRADVVAALATADAIG